MNEAAHHPQKKRWASCLGAGFIQLGLALLLGACPSPARFPSGLVSKPVTLSGLVYRPEGNGPFPAMVLLHTCGGVGRHVLNWAQWLTGEGYIALVVDSLSSRGTASVCREQRNPTVEEVAWDAFGGLAYLRSLAFVEKDRIGVMGWSYGGSAALVAASAWRGERAQLGAGGFRAAVGFYPWCGYLQNDTAPVLLLLAEHDKEPRPEQCTARGQWIRESGRTVDWIIYRGAEHGFDQAELGLWTIVNPRGYIQQYDPAATADAAKRIRSFLSEYLR